MVEYGSGVIPANLLAALIATVLRMAMSCYGPEE